MDAPLEDIIHSAVQDLFDDGESFMGFDLDARLPAVLVPRPGGSQSWEAHQHVAQGGPSRPSEEPSDAEGDEHQSGLSDEEDGDDAPAQSGSTSDLPSAAPALHDDDVGLTVSPANANPGILARSRRGRPDSSLGPSSSPANLTIRAAGDAAASGASSEPSSTDESESSRRVKIQGMLASLQADKSRLKRYLRAEDEKFEREHKRKPLRADKEHLRPMYERYRVLKREIDDLTAKLKAGDSAATAPASRHTATEETTPSLDSLRQQKRELQIQLRRFEHEFQQTHGRAVRFHKDIRPVEADYRRYKDLKRRIAELERK